MKTNMKINDIVRIASQPDNQTCSLVNTVGFIEELDEKTAIIQALNVDGTSSGGGSVPINCLKKEEGEEWKQAFKLYNKRIEHNVDIMKTNLENVDKILEEIGKKYNLTGKQVFDIANEFSKRKEEILLPYN